MNQSMYILERSTNLQIYKFTNLQVPKIEFWPVTFVTLSFCHFSESFNENLRCYIECLSDTPVVTVCHSLSPFLPINVFLRQNFYILFFIVFTCFIGNIYEV